MKKVLFHLTSFEQGGAERVISNLSGRLAEDGYDVVVTTQWEGPNEFKLNEKVKRIDVGLGEKDAKANRIVKAFARLINLRKAIRDEKPDVVISFLKKNNYRALLANMGNRIPNIIAVRNDPKSDYVSKMDKYLIPLLFPRAEGAVFQTEEQRDFFTKSLSGISEVILNPVHNKYILKELPAQKEKMVIHSGRLVGFKNQEMLVRAFIKVHEKHPDYKLLIYGRDSLDGTKEKLESIISRNNADEYVKLMGPSDELEKIIPKAEIYAFSSYYEGLPNALIEAMAMRMPIVATDCPCGGPRTLIKHGENGLLIPVNDEEAMVNSLCRLIEDKEYARRLGENAGKISKRVNEDAIIEQWKTFIDKVINQSRKK